MKNENTKCSCEISLISNKKYNEDKFKDECGIVGIWNAQEASNIAYLCLYAQQHRGQEGAGVVALHQSNTIAQSEATEFFSHKGMGLVSEVFHRYDFSKLPGNHAIGHVRYTTTGSSSIQNVQPFMAEIAEGKVSVAHNGNIINADFLRRKLINEGSIFSSTSDTEVLLHLLAREHRSPTFTENLIHSLQQLVGAYSFVILNQDSLYAVRDPQGFRPLCMGRLGEGILFASETCAFDLVGAEYIRDVEPGELVRVSGKGASEIKSFFPFNASSATPCIFEYVYFARPDSYVYGKNVYPIRKQMGIQLAREAFVEADIVVPVPDSGVPAASGFSQASGIPLELGLVRNHYIGRTFIEPKQSIRDFGVRIKLNANKEILKGKRVIVIDDSIVRGTTSKKIVTMLRNAGAKEVHMRISAPPTIAPCYYGIDTPNKAELIASSKDVSEIAKFIGADTLQFLSVEGLYQAMEDPLEVLQKKEKSASSEALHCNRNQKYCDACFTGNYPIGTPKDYQ
jgi:amidophosphoribosyltransferase